MKLEETVESDVLDVLRWLQGVKRSVDNFKISPYNTAEIIAVKVLLNPTRGTAFDGFCTFYFGNSTTSVLKAEAHQLHRDYFALFSELQPFR